MDARFDVIVIGGGHAGVEAARAAAAALGDGRVALVTMDPSRIGQMSCNPAIGGLAKGQMVREVDALGGLMGRAIDASGIMFKLLNASKGPAVRGPRAQADKHAYAAEVQALLAEHAGIAVLRGTVERIDVAGGVVAGVTLGDDAGPVAPDPRRIEAHRAAGGRSRPIYPAERDPGPPVCRLAAGAVVLTTGTFMRGLMHTGDERCAGGRIGEGAAVGISAALRDLGFALGRLKTGTPPRLARASIDWDALEPQAGDDPPRPFSDLSPAGLPGGRFPHLPQVECRITRTAPEAHALIRANLHRAPMYAGAIEAECGPRYCPSIEDKVVRFADRDSHQVFLEPESLFTNEIYCNGISTSLPADVQETIVRTMPGCARAEILRWGYAVEYDMVWPHQIDATGMTKRVDGLFLAGQINCTTGYEEAAAQGLVAGLNAARFARGQEPVRLGRDEAMIGVLMDDLCTKTPREPYRMFTSRAEHRLHLRADNADVRLTARGVALGLVDEPRRRAFAAREAERARVRAAIAGGTLDGARLADLARRSDVDAATIARGIAPPAAPARVEEVLVEIRYAGYIERERAALRRHAESEHRSLPTDIDYRRIPSLRAEAVEVLERFRPATLGQAARLAGVNPTDVTIVQLALRRRD